MKKITLVITAILLIIVSYIFLFIVGRVFTIEYVLPKSDLDIAKNTELGFTIDPESTGEVSIVEQYVKGDTLHLTLKGKKAGRIILTYDGPNNLGSFFILFVHKNRIITFDDFFGCCTGSTTVRIVWILYFILLEVALVKKYRDSIKLNLYSYKNILYLGLILFTGAIVLFQILWLPQKGGIVDVVVNIFSNFYLIEFFTFPVTVILFFMVTASNIKLMKNEGKNWRNMLGAILGIMMVVAPFVQRYVERYFQNSTLIDVHNWTGTGRFIEMFVDNTLGIIISYSECILVATIVLGFKAARHIPAYDKDYIIILGCQIKKDGTLTKLLQGRTDRAIEFGKKQNEVSGKDIIYIPSGGKGDDEIMSEAEAIRNYMLEVGIPEDQILLEDKAVNTRENLTNSMKLITERSGSDARIAFSTTNYHVFRAGLLATNEGIKADGVGSKTKRYFWINAFVREFIATVYSEKRTHAFVFGIMMLLNLMTVIFTYISNVVLS